MGALILNMNNTLINQITYDNVVIRVPKGTTADFGIEIEDESTGEKYNPTSSTKVVFSVKKYKTDSNVLISKILDYDAISNTYSFTILPEDTSSLPLGRYYFDICLSESENFFQQVVSTSIFMITASISANPAQEE